MHESDVVSWTYIKKLLNWGEPAQKQNLHAHRNNRSRISVFTPAVFIPSRNWAAFSSFFLQHCLICIMGFSFKWNIWKMLSKTMWVVFVSRGLEEIKVLYTHTHTRIYIYIYIYIYTYLYTYIYIYIWTVKILRTYELVSKILTL